MRRGGLALRALWQPCRRRAWYATQHSADYSTPPTSDCDALWGDVRGVLAGAAKVLVHMTPPSVQQTVDDFTVLQQMRAAASAHPAEAAPATPGPPSGRPVAAPADPGGAPPASPVTPAPAAPSAPAAAPAEPSPAAAVPSPPPPPAPPAPPAGGSARIAQANVRAVPAGPVSRAWHFGTLFTGLAVGSMAQYVRNAVAAPEERRSILLSDANMDRMVTTLCRMRGAVLKLGQMLSIQDEAVMPPALLAAFARVRDAADIMPQHQLEGQLATNFGPQWRDCFRDFDLKPVASASIGQVHAAVLPDGTKVAVKVQFPGVAQSIDSDVNNLTRLFTFNLLPSGLYVENILRELRRELREECDYVREAEKLTRYKRLLEQDPSLRGLEVPAVIPDLSTANVLTMTYVVGTPIDRVPSLGLPQAVRNRLGENLFRLTLAELFKWRYMQTDPNFSNFLYNAERDRIYLLDFGAAREYDREFIRTYLRVVDAARRHDTATVLDLSRKLGFLTGEENELMNDAHCKSVFLLAEPFGADGVYDFHKAQIPARIASNVGVMLKHRLRPPPTEVYSLHRRLSGLYLGCAQIGASLAVKPMFEAILREADLS
eukprot:EG_transcript_6595